MSPAHFRPQVRAPWQAIAAFAVALYIIRSAMRGWNFRPEILDVLVFGALALILLARPLIERMLGPDEEADPADRTEGSEDPPA